MKTPPWLKKNIKPSHRNKRVYRDEIRPEKLRLNPYCEMCIKDQRLKQAVEVDHIIPVEDGGDPYDCNNLQSLCKQCHIKKTSKENSQRHWAKQRDDGR